MLFRRTMLILTVASLIACFGALLGIAANTALAGERGAKPPPDKAPAVAAYSAVQKNGMVVVRATGENPTAGWKNVLESTPGSPPEFQFTQKKPEGIVAQVITPFSVEASAKTTTKIDFVFVSDASGKHQVRVDQGK